MWAVSLGVRASGLLDRLYRPEIDLYTLGIVTSVVLVLTYRYQSVRYWKLGEYLVVYAGRRYRPAVIREVQFAPDPSEEFDEVGDAARLCEVRAVLRRGGYLRLVVSVRDAVWVRAWADRHGIPVRDPSGFSVIGSAGPDDL